MAKEVAIPIERYIEEIRDGIGYKGYVKIANITLDYEIRFAVPIPKLGDMEQQPTGYGEVRNLFQITLSKEGASIDLSNEEFLFFFDLIAPFAIAFCATKFMVKYENGEVALPAKAIWENGERIGITSSETRNLSLQTCYMLQSPKFGYSVTV